MELNYFDKHYELMQKLCKPCYSNDKGFQNKERLNAISSILKESPYTKYSNDYVHLYIKGKIEDLQNKPVILVSSHIDNVPSITKLFVERHGNKIYGTFDNMITNAVSSILMLEEDLPNNIVFAFTSDEETGRFYGLYNALYNIKQFTNNILGIALDVTYEGYKSGKLFSFENMQGNKIFIDYISENLLKIEPKEIKTFSVAPINKKYIPQKLLNNGYKFSSYGDCDEAFGLRSNNINGFSFCLPGTGPMHSNKGMETYISTFEGYRLSLASLLYSLSKEYPNKIKSYTDERKKLFNDLQNIIKEESKQRNQMVNISSVTSQNELLYDPMEDYYSFLATSYNDSDLEIYLEDMHQYFDYSKASRKENLLYFTTIFNEVHKETNLENQISLSDYSNNDFYDDIIE